MWRRWNNNRGTSIGNPTLIETTLDEGYLETIPEVSESIKSKRSSVAATLPDLPFRTVPPLSNPPERDSIYSQPSPTLPSTTYADEESSIEDSDNANSGSDISPISTPRHTITQAPGPSISPIPSTVPLLARAPVPEQNFQSHIPRRVPVPTYSQKEQTKWDEHSGEPTFDERGKPATVAPGTQPLEMQYPQLKERTKQILAGLREREVAKKWGKQPLQPVAPVDPLDHPLHREPWKGASGRSAIVEPVQNQPNADKVPNHLPQKNISPVDVNQTPIQLMESPAPPTVRSAGSLESIKPLAPLKIMASARKANAEEPIKLQSPFQSPQAASIHDSVTIHRSDSPQYAPEPVTPTTPTRVLDSDKEQYQAMERDASRFSWTTYATTVDESPRSIAGLVREDSPPPVPDLPAPIIFKRRTVSEGLYGHPSALTSFNSVVRKPVPRASTQSSRSVSMSKSLPPVPAQLEAVDKISGLEAQLEGLARQKHNINRIIRGLEDNLRRNAVYYNMWKRREVEKNIINHKIELDSVMQESHAISLLLHRAQRKRDKDNNYEQPTGLWIKRVTT